MNRWIYAVAAGGFVATAAQADEKRELDAHVHGESVLKIAVEGDEVEMVLEAPGFDIVGFEYEAESAEDKAKIEAALETLGAPAQLFELVGGGCSVKSVEVSLLDDDEDHDHDHGHDHGAKAEHDHDHGDKQDDHAHGHDDHGHDDHGHEETAEDRHSEFEAEYALSCSSIGGVTALDASGFFSAFAGTAEVLEATIVSGQGQREVEMDADNPRAALDGGV